jgi:hypothetical protein
MSQLTQYDVILCWQNDPTRPLCSTALSSKTFNNTTIQQR